METVNPFVCHKRPFVGAYRPFIRPSVCHTYPYVGLRILAADFRGFTLVELMAVLVVASILAVLAAPSLNSFIANQRVTNQVNELLGDLNFARSEAIKRSVTITVCKSADPDSATPSCNATVGDPWRSGRMVFVDSTNIGTRDANEQILRVRQELDGVSSTANTIVGDANTANLVTFKANGTTTLLGESQLAVCDKRGNTQGIAVAIAATGRSRATDKGKNMAGAALALCP